MNLVYVAPFRSVAAALVLALLFGPIGLYYASLIGGLVMTFLALVAAGLVVKQHSPLPMLTIWLLSFVWSMCAVRWYNYRLWRSVTKVANNEMPVAVETKLDKHD